MQAFDSSFIELVQSKTPNAMEKAGLFFYKHYETKIKAYALKSKVSPPTEANTVVIDTFLDLVETIKSNALQTDCDTYLWGTVRKLVGSKLHEYKKETQKMDYPGELPNPAPYFLHDETSRTALDLWDERSKNILEGLSPKDREVVQAYLNETTNLRAIADQLGEKDGTIRKRWHLLMGKLRKLLTNGT